MIKGRLSATSLLLAALLFAPPAQAQQQARPPGSGKPLEPFNEDADRRAGTLLFKALQFEAPYPGHYQRLSLDNDGNALNVRVVPDWAMQNSRSAKLDGPRLAQLRQALARLNLDSYWSSPEPQPGRTHTALVFHDGRAFRRYDFDGPLPPPAQAIIDTLKAELEKAAELKSEEVVKHRELMEELYGDWQNKSGVALVSASRSDGLRGARALLLTTTGRRNQTPPAGPVDVSIYHALIFYPEARLTGAGGTGTWSHDPLSTQQLLWDAPAAGHGAGDEKASGRTLEIKYHAVDGTVSVGGKSYRLSDGNMFVVRIDENWAPAVSQPGASVDEQASGQKVLGRFKAALRYDESIQQLELK